MTTGSLFNFFFSSDNFTILHLHQFTSLLYMPIIVINFIAFSPAFLTITHERVGYELADNQRGA